MGASDENTVGQLEVHKSIDSSSLSQATSILKLEHFMLSKLHCGP